MSTPERRKHPRIKINNLVTYVCLDEDGTPIKTMMATAVDISQGGIKMLENLLLQLSICHGFAPDDKLQIHVDVRNDSKAVFTGDESFRNE